MGFNTGRRRPGRRRPSAFPGDAWRRLTSAVNIQFSPNQHILGKCLHLCTRGERPTFYIMHYIIDKSSLGSLMKATIKIDTIEVDRVLYDFVTREALPGTGIAEAAFWSGFASLARRFSARIAQLLEKRDRLQSSIDAWHREHPGAQFDPPSYKAFLAHIGYLVPEQAAFTVDTANVDAEIARIAGPQLVVPVSNARYALNAAQKWWNSRADFWMQAFRLTLVRMVMPSPIGCQSAGLRSNSAPATPLPSRLRQHSRASKAKPRLHRRFC
jgi:Malate synthase